MLDEGSEIGAVFFDLRKVFDSVPHKVLMEKLQQTGLNINILAWVGNYLTSRKQMVVVNGSSSSDSQEQTLLLSIVISSPTSTNTHSYH